MSFIRAAVNVFINGFISSRNDEIYGPSKRIDNVEEDGRAETLKQEVTTIVGAVLNKQQCWEESAYRASLIRDMGLLLA